MGWRSEWHSIHRQHFSLALSHPKLVHQCLHSLMFMSNPEELRSAARWSGMGKESRKELMDRLQHFLPPSIMLPPHRYIYRDRTTTHNSHCYFVFYWGTLLNKPNGWNLCFRLETLILQAVEQQKTQCAYHNTCTDTQVYFTRQIHSVRSVCS